MWVVLLGLVLSCQCRVEDSIGYKEIVHNAKKTISFVSRASWRNRLLDSSGSNDDEIDEYLHHIVSFLQDGSTLSASADPDLRRTLSQVPKELQDLAEVSNPFQTTAQSLFKTMVTNQHSFVPKKFWESQGEHDLEQSEGSNQPENPLGSRPSVPVPIPNPLKMFSSGIHKLMSALGQEGFGPMSEKMKQTLSQAVGYVPGTYGYDPFGAGIMQNRRTQGETSSETNLCYALLETWMRSCSAPQLFFLQTSVITSHVLAGLREEGHNQRHAAVRAIMNHSNCIFDATDDGWGVEVRTKYIPGCIELHRNLSHVERALGLDEAMIVNSTQTQLSALSLLAEKVLIELAQMPPMGSAELDNSVDPRMDELMQDAKVMAQSGELDADPVFSEPTTTQPRFWSLWDGQGSKELDPEEQANNEKEVERLRAEGQAHIDHDKLVATLMSHGLDENGAHFKAGRTNPLAPQTAGRPQAPALPIFSALSGMFGAIAQMVGGVTKLSNTSGRIVGALDRATGANGMRQLVGLVLGLFAAFMNMGVAKGQRPGMAAPEAYDPHGPYGPDPFPFQTPGSEKCHRFLTSWLAKCS